MEAWPEMRGLASLGTKLHDVGDHVLETIGETPGLFYDPEHPHDTLALSPFFGAPFGYHQWRQGRSNIVTSLASLAISVASTEAIFLLAGRTAGFTSLEWGLGRGLSILGVRYGGRSFTMGAIFGPRAGYSATFGWSVPVWLWAILTYEAIEHRWFEGTLSSLPFDTWEPQIY